MVKATAEEGVDYEGKFEFLVLEVDANETESYGTYLELTLGFQNKEADFEPSVGFPLNLNPNSQLGQLIQEVTGEELEVGAEYDLEELLQGEIIEAELIRNEEGFYEVVKDKNGQLAITKV